MLPTCQDPYMMIRPNVVSSGLEGEILKDDGLDYGHHMITYAYLWPIYRVQTALLSNNVANMQRVNNQNYCAFKILF